ncbi:MAG: mercuric ion binding protein, partial [Saprospiraceae bacterium]
TMNAQEQKEEATPMPALKKEVFTVYGNCNMCKRAIEGNVKLLAGINEAVWNKETDQMTVSFDPKVITFDAIKQKIADTGYDSDTHRATKEAYNNLPGCCQYDRPEIKVD